MIFELQFVRHKQYTDQLIELLYTLDTRFRRPGIFRKQLFLAEFVAELEEVLDECLTHIKNDGRYSIATRFGYQ
jgi:hypothetical protein